jgi:hypothetical protein
MRKRVPFDPTQGGHPLSADGTAADPTYYSTQMILLLFHSNDPTLFQYPPLLKLSPQPFVHSFPRPPPIKNLGPINPYPTTY